MALTVYNAEHDCWFDQVTGVTFKFNPGCSGLSMIRAGIELRPLTDLTSAQRVRLGNCLAEVLSAQRKSNALKGG